MASGGTSPTFTRGAEEASGLTSDKYFNELRKVMEQDCELHKKKSECHQLAEFYQSVDKNFPAATKLYEGLCNERGYAPSCLNLGLITLRGKGIGESTDSDALKLFTRACELGSGDGCSNAGMLLRTGGPHVQKEPQRAAEYFATACERDSKNGCYMLSVMYLQGRDGFAKDMGKSFTYAAKSCEMGHLWGCINAGRMCSIGDGVPQNAELARKYKEAATHLAGKETHTQPQ